MARDVQEENIYERKTKVMHDYNVLYKMYSLVRILHKCVPYVEFWMSYMF